MDKFKSVGHVTNYFNFSRPTARMSDLRIFIHSHSRPLVRGVLLKSVFRFESKLLVRDFFDSWETFSPLRYLFAQDGLDQLNSGARSLTRPRSGLDRLSFQGVHLAKRGRLDLRRPDGKSFFSCKPIYGA